MQSCCTSPPYSTLQLRARRGLDDVCNLIGIHCIIYCTTSFESCQGLLVKILLFANNSSLCPAELQGRPRAGGNIQQLPPPLPRFALGGLTKCLFCVVAVCVGGGFARTPPQLAYVCGAVRFPRPSQNKAFCIIVSVSTPRSFLPQGGVAPQWLALRVVPRGDQSYRENAADAAGLPRRKVPPA